MYSLNRVSTVSGQDHAVGEGTDAEAAAYVQLNVDGRPVCGAALDHDTVSAPLKAVLSAINRAHSLCAQAA